MLNIDNDIFAFNLSLTQEYCRQQKGMKKNDHAKIFRSYNPIVNDKPIFSFEVGHSLFEIEPGLSYYTSTKWAIDPTERENENLIEKLFEQQINFKQKHVIIDNAQTYHGDILVSQIDGTVTDGASEVESLGLIDIYDMPPIDTWFYLTKSSESRLLFAWIPKSLRHYANEAVFVNCVDCINWFEQKYPNDYRETMAG